MRREHFEHVVAAASEVTGEQELVVIGSQAILGPYPNAPESMLRSLEADMYPRQRPEKADDIDSNLGDGSHFQATYGYYAHGVGPETAKAPVGWEERLIRIEIPTRVGSKRQPVALCLEPHDLVLAKCVAARQRDWDFAKEALRHRLVDHEVLFRRVAGLPVDEEHRLHVKTMLDGIVKQLRREPATGGVAAPD